MLHRGCSALQSAYTSSVHLSILLTGSRDLAACAVCSRSHGPRRTSQLCFELCLHALVHEQPCNVMKGLELVFYGIMALFKSKGWQFCTPWNTSSCTLKQKKAF